jgi:5'-methylthioadenosine phosphorylase
VRPFTFFGSGIVAHVAFDKPLCSEMRAALLEAARDAGQDAADGATLCVMEGPQFSTLAESQFHRRNGFDLIGMTALPEAKLAREAEICYGLLALVTDYDCWHPSHDSVTVESVVQVLHSNVRNAQAVIRGVVGRLTAEPACACAGALENAIMTAPAHIPADARQRLRLIIGKYLD